MLQSHGLKMNYLSDKIKKRSAIQNLKSETSDSRLSFFTKQDSDNFHSRNLLTQDQCEEIISICYDENGKLTINGEYLNPNLTYCIDFETTGIDPHIDTIKVMGLSDGYNHRYVQHNNDAWKDLGKLIDELTKHKTIAYNLQFEHQFIWVNFGIDFQFYSDPMILAYNFYNKSSKELKLSKLSGEILSRFPKSLEELANRKFTSSKPFDWKEDAEPLLTDVCVYCCEDCYETLLLHEYLTKQLSNKGLHKLENIVTLDIKATHTASRMSLRGVKIDSQKLPEMEQDINAYISILQSEIESGCGWYANPKSPKQMNQLLFGQLGLDTSELKKSTHGFSVDAKSRQLLVSQHPVVKKYDYIAKCTDALNKYVTKMPNWINSKNGRIHTNFNTCMTLTGRLSSSNPNLQNIPNPDKYKSTGNEFIAKLGQDIRDLFIAENDKKLIACDYSSFELRILAHLSKDPTLIQVFRDGNSLHNVMTEKLFGINYDPNNPDHKAKRTVTKTINFGLCYGLTYKRLYEECKLRGMNWTQNDCQNIINEYWRMLDTLSSWFERIKFNAVIRGYTETMYGRRRYYQFSRQCKDAIVNCHTIEQLQDYMTKNDAEFLRQAGNHVIQGTNADAIRLAMIECEKIPDCDLLLQIHDELVFESDKPEIVAEQIKKTMESCIKLDVPVIAEPKIADKWGQTK